MVLLERIERTYKTEIREPELLRMACSSWRAVRRVRHPESPPGEARCETRLSRAAPTAVSACTRAPGPAYTYNTATGRRAVCPTLARLR